VNAPGLRAVVLDHFFGQDIEALREASQGSIEWRIVPYYRFRDAANRILPEPVQQGLQLYASRELADARARWVGRLRREVARLYREWPFDVLVLPSDTFYYVRDLWPICHDLGVPVFVAQKETTITHDTFDLHAPELAAHAPFAVDYMTVCSERHKSFWVRAGAAPGRIEVTGQPRFDLYARDGVRPRWTDVGLADAPRTVLFLSYQIDAYLHGQATDWGPLREQTEGALWDSVSHGWRVVVKMHPQQRRDDAEQIVATAPGSGRDVVLADPEADTRLLLLLADAVVGFQSTALLEALALPKPVAYAGWGQLHDEVSPRLIPFWTLDGVKVASSRDDLAGWLASSPPVPDAETVARRRSLAEWYLGPFDGRASERTVAAITRLTAEWSSRREESEWRQRLDRLVLPSALGALGRCAAEVPAWHALGFVGGAVGWKRVAEGASVRRGTASERLARAREMVRDALVRRAA
jgi:hypothetical protein